MTRYLLVAGAQRCGTTYLHHLLDEHPEIAMARPAQPEPKFFLNPNLISKGLDWYEATYFSSAEAVPVHGEKSTSYIESTDAAARAAGMLPDADVLVMLRDPVARAISNWRFSTDSGFEQRSLDLALKESFDRPRDWDPTSTSVSPFAYLERGRYADYLEPWLQRFRRVHVYCLEELAGNAYAVGHMYQAIGVDTAFRPPSLGTVVNAATRLDEEIETSLQLCLRRYFADSDARLQEVLGRPLPWPGEE